MNTLRRIFYFSFFNFIIRNLLFPLKFILPEKFKIPVNGIIKVHLKERSILFAANETSHMLRELYWNHSKCDFEFSVIFSELISKSNVFFDIGANIGYYSILAKKVNHNSTVVAFEPSNGPFYYLQKNVEINHLDKIIINKLAVGSNNCLIEFFEDINPKFKYVKFHVSGAGNTANTWNSQDTNRYNVECITLNDYIFNNKIASLDLLKIDTEATEDKVLQGGIESIIKFQPIIICEVLHNKIEDKILEIVQKIDYLIFQHIEDQNALILVDNFNSSLFRNYFFVPKSKIEWIEKFITHQTHIP